MNFAAVWKVPAVFVCVDNGWAISVCSKKQTAAESYADKAIAYGMPGVDVDGNDVLACYSAVREAVNAARAGRGPSLVVLKTYRMMGHSSSDDATRYRDKAEVEQWEKRDPLRRFTRFLERRRVLAAGEYEQLEAKLLAEIDKVVHEQESAPPMPLRSLVEDVYAEVPRHLRRQYNEFVRIAERHGEAQKGEGAFPL
jgi:TPP-dependent pyruvate/acetoin dehydrogenase alpha subunit